MRFPLSVSGGNFPPGFPTETGLKLHPTPSRNAIHAPACARWTEVVFFVSSPWMSRNWKLGLAVRRLGEGCTYVEAARAARIDRVTLWRWRRACPEFDRAVDEARRAGEAERTYRLWLRHPFRGRRPPTGRGHGGKPRFRYGFGRGGEGRLCSKRMYGGQA